MADIICANTTFAEVKSKIASAVSGDRVLIPAGTVVFNSNLASGDPFGAGEDTTLQNKAIMIEGGYGGGETIFSQQISGAVYPQRPQAIWWRTIDHPTYTSGFKNITFTTPGGQQGSICTILGNTSKWKMSNCRIIPNGYAGFFFEGYVRGVNHNNYWDVTRGYANYVFNGSEWGNTGIYGYNSWAQPHTMGTAESLFFENETFENTQALGFFAFALDGWYGCRRTVRYCTFINCNCNDHGTESPGLPRSARQLELYNCTFQFAMGTNSLSSPQSCRGGTALIYNNTLTTTGTGLMSRFIVLANQRNDLGAPNEPFFPWGWAGRWTPTNVSVAGTSVTVTMPNTLNQSLYYHSFRNTTQYIEMRGWTPAAYNGVWRVTGFTDQTVTFSVATAPGSLPTVTGKIMSPWDGNTNDLGYPCLDQAGSGASANITTFINGDIPVPPTAGTPAQGAMNQAREPVYAWNNRFNGTHRNVFVDGAWSQQIILENRDYFNRAPVPGDPGFPNGYTAYTYPHPLNTGGGGVDTTPPATPTGFVVI